jgi:hypothetical protein
MGTVEPQPLGRGKGVNLLVYGLPGAGKTRLAGSGKRVLIIRPPNDHTDSIPEDADVTELVVSDWSRMLEVFQWLQQGAHSEYDWVWLDSISLMQDVLLDDVMDDAITRRPDRAMDKGGVMVPEFGPDKGEYKINFERLKKWVRDMGGLAKAGQINFGITAHPFEWRDQVAEEEFWAPWVQGKNMSPAICGYMNIVAYLEEVRRDDEEPRRVLMTDAVGFVGKDQFHCFPELKSGRHGIVDPTMADVMKAINGARSSGRPATRKRTKARKRRSS